MNDLILKCDGSVTENLLLTATVRDIHRSLPGMFRTGVRTAFPEVWENNPYLTLLEESAPGVIAVDCRNSLIQMCNDLPVHSLQGYRDYVNEQLGIRIQPTEFKADLHLSATELDPSSIPPLLEGWERRYWILHAGSTRRHTVKAWHAQRFQEIVDRYAGRIQFVQVGLIRDVHPDLKGVIDLRGKTSFRDLICLVRHADGILTSSGLLAHLAAAVEMRPRHIRSCIVIAGGREPAHWAAYPGQQYMDTIGLLPCCKTGGCWRSRTRPLKDGRREDDPDQICLALRDSMPRCMDLIIVPEVVMRIDRELHKNKLFVSERQMGRMANPAGAQPDRVYSQGNSLTAANALAEAERFIAGIDPYPGTFAGRGIVICGGGTKYFSNAWVCIKMLRHLGCSLPIQLWHLGREEMDWRMEMLLKPLNVQTKDALEARQQHPVRRLFGWELKPYALIHSRFKEVLFLDADNVPVVNPESLFETPQFRDTGAVFWPDFGHLKPEAPIWKLCGVKFRDEPEWESGQILVDKERAWQGLQLALWYNEHSDFFYDYVLGDKETFHLAFRRLNLPVAMPSTPVRALEGTLCQHDFEGRRIFQHRVSPKWKLMEYNIPIAGFEYETECLAFLDELREKWGSTAQQVDRLDFNSKPERLKSRIQQITANVYDYIRVGYGSRPMTFSANGSVKMGADGCERFWDLREDDEAIIFEIYNENFVTCRLTENGEGIWKGKWLYFEKMPVELRPVAPQSNGHSRQSQPRNSDTLARKNSIIFRGPMDGYSGYGLHAIEIVRHLRKRGYDVAIRAHRLDERHASIPPDVRRQIECRDVTAEWDLILAPPGSLRLRPGTRSVVFTMWESTRISELAVDELNRAHLVIVPCHWNAACFNACGVERQIRVVPLGINTTVFRPVPLAGDGPCIFGVAGRLESGGMRKGINEAIQTFQRAFPDEKDVRLHVKVFSDDPVLPVDDDRIVLTNRYLGEEQLAQWYAGLTCFLSCSHGEAWGLMLHQALAVGRPVISPAYGGVTEFFNGEVGYPVDFRLGPAQGPYSGMGVWAECEENSVVDQMRRVFQNREEAREKGLLAARSVAPLSWERSNDRLIKLMVELEMISPPDTDTAANGKPALPVTEPATATAVAPPVLRCPD
jgi:glycosyltransferase involved in cell wall biosynthesis